MEVEKSMEGGGEKGKYDFLITLKVAQKCIN